METFTLYDKNTGFINSSGTITRDLERDGSTLEEYIERKLLDLDLAIVYFENTNLPDKDKYKISDGKIVELSEEEKQPTEEQLYESAIKAKEAEYLRAKAIELIELEKIAAEKWGAVITPGESRLCAKKK